jgi:hypothetical protein
MPWVPKACQGAKGMPGCRRHVAVPRVGCLPHVIDHRKPEECKRESGVKVKREEEMKENELFLGIVDKQQDVVYKNKWN